MSNRIHVKRTDESQIIRGIDEEAKKLYRDRYGKRNPNTLSTQELDDITNEAGKRVQDKRKGRLIP